MYSCMNETGRRKRTRGLIGIKWSCVLAAATILGEKERERESYPLPAVIRRSTLFIKYFPREFPACLSSLFLRIRREKRDDKGISAVLHF